MYCLLLLHATRLRRLAKPEYRLSAAVPEEAPHEHPPENKTDHNHTPASAPPIKPPADAADDDHAEKTPPLRSFTVKERSGGVFYAAPANRKHPIPRKCPTRYTAPANRQCPIPANSPAVATPTPSNITIVCNMDICGGSVGANGGCPKRRSTILHKRI